MNGNPTKKDAWNIPANPANIPAFLLSILANPKDIKNNEYANMCNGFSTVQPNINIDEYKNIARSVDFFQANLSCLAKKNIDVTISRFPISTQTKCAASGGVNDSQEYDAVNKT